MLQDYDVQAIVNDLQKKMRILDCDLELQILSAKEMEENGFKETTLGGCVKTRTTNFAYIYINKDSKKHHGDNKIWLNTIAHELLHVVTDNMIFTTETVIDLIKNERKRDVCKEDIDTRYEQMVDMLSKGYINALPENYLEQFKIKGDDYGKN